MVATKKYRGKMAKVAAGLVKDYATQYNLDKECIWLVYTVGLSEEVMDAVKKAITECGFASQRWIMAKMRLIGLEIMKKCRCDLTRILTLTSR